MIMYLTLSEKKRISNKLRGVVFHFFSFFLVLDFPKEVSECSEIAIYGIAQWYHILYNFHPWLS